MNADSEKQLAAKASLDFIKDGMNIGLGTGSTSEMMVKLLAEKVRQGLRVQGVPTSVRTRQLAENLSIPLISFDDVDSLDIDIDGADEIDPRLQLIKGGGGALLREKIVASSARQVIIVADSRKMVRELGAFKLPVEVIPFGGKAIEHAIRELGGKPVLRQTEGKPYLTDQQNWILDCDFGAIQHPGSLALALSAVPGVVEHGLFVDIATVVIVGRGDKVEIFRRQNLPATGK